MPAPANSWEQSVGRPSLSPVVGQTAWNLRWWIMLAVLTSSVIHLGLFYVLGDLRMAGAPVADETAAAEDTRFEDQIQLDPKMLEQTLAAAPEITDQKMEKEMDTELPPVDQIVEHLKGDITFSPETEIPKNIQMSAAAQGDVGKDVDVISAVDTAIAGGINEKIKAASTSELLKTAKANDDQVKISIQEKAPTGDTNMKSDLAAARKKGDDGLRGLGFSTIDDLMNIKTPVTGDLKAMMPSDLLFDYNSADIKESAKLSLMNLGYLIQTWTKSKIIVEGHTDTTGDDAYNDRLSLMRAESVKNFVVNSLRVNGDRIETIGYGEKQPIANPNGDQNAQAINRRVVIRFINP